MTKKAGVVEIEIHRIPTLNERGKMRVAIGIDGEEPVLIEGTNRYMNDSDGDDRWGKGVLENNEKLSFMAEISQEGLHTLQMYYVDPGIIVDKIVIYTSKKTQSYFAQPVKL